MSVMLKCDVVIPVYKSPEWVELCLYALFQNTQKDTLGKVFLINDSDDEFSKNCLNNLKEKYGDRIVVKQNKKNLGFTETTNVGLKLSTADYVLLLNTDCLVSKNTIEKLMKHMQSDEKIGMICPISSNAANLSLGILEGFTYTQMDELLEERFSGMLFDACTVVGNCMMISRRCINEVGILDEIYSPGYGEETDYQFKAMEKGFSAKIAIDTYVFHKAETSFGISEAKQKMIKEHADIFFSRWGEEYHKELEKYNKNDPIKYILNDFEKNPPKIKNSAMFYVMNLGMSGGCNVIVDTINRLAINGHQCNILYDTISDYSEFLLFKPVPMKHLDAVKTNKIVATLWITAFKARQIADEKNWELVYFVQGLEQQFENGRNYGSVEVSYKLSNNLITVSKPLQKWIKEVYSTDSCLIRNGINLELLKNKRKNTKIRSMLFILRDDYLKCDHVLLDILRKIDNSMKNIEVSIITNNNIVLPLFTNKSNKYNIIEGPLSRTSVFELMSKSDIYVDSSSSEGFGLTALESMAAGCIPVVSDSIGVGDYIVNAKNGMLVKEINNVDIYCDRIEQLMNDAELRQKIYDGMEATVKKYDFNDRISEYASVLCGEVDTTYHPSLTSDEKQIYDKVIKKFEDNKQSQGFSKKQKIIRKTARVLPRPARRFLVKCVEYLKACY